jgi:hypothetical protein
MPFKIMLKRYPGLHVIKISKSVFGRIHSRDCLHCKTEAQCKVRSVFFIHKDLEQTPAGIPSSLQEV